MLVSAEMRWFWKASCPTEVEKWFQTSGEPPGGGDQDRPRIDRYYKSAGHSELGIKIRDDVAGKPREVEIKGLVGVRDDTDPLLPTRRVEIWCKWKGPAFEPASCLVTEKVRWMRKFDAGSDVPIEISLESGTEKPVSGAKLPDIGCNIELTKVKVGGQTETWWTLCFEAFGGLDTAPRALRKVISVAGPIPPLDGDLLSYPAWLNGL